MIHNLAQIEATLYRSSYIWKEFPTNQPTSGISDIFKGVDLICKGDIYRDILRIELEQSFIFELH